MSGDDVKGDRVEMVVSPHLRYRVVPGWEQLAGRLHAPRLRRRRRRRRRTTSTCSPASSPGCIVYDRDGTFLRSWGEGLFTDRTHGLTVGPDGSVYCVDEGNHCVHKFTPDGRAAADHRHRRASPSDTGYDGTLESITRRPAVQPADEPRRRAERRPLRLRRLRQLQGPPLLGRRRADPVLGRAGHRARASSTCRTASAVAADGRVLVADRENDRIQIFTPDGEFLERVDGRAAPDQPRDRRRRARLRLRAVVAGRAALARARRDRRRPPGPGQRLRRRRAGAGALGGPDRARRATSSRRTTSASTPSGDIYVAEVTRTFAGKAGPRPAGRHTFQKFAVEA